MGHIFERTELMIGTDAMKKLQHSTVAVIGIGGVGSYITEALVRSGIGSFVLIDGDKIESTNLNRQLHTNMYNIGHSKVESMKERILSINPDAHVFAYEIFLTEENMNLLWQHKPQYIADAIDSVSSKLNLVVEAKKGMFRSFLPWARGIKWIRLLLKFQIFIKRDTVHWRV